MTAIEESVTPSASPDHGATASEARVRRRTPLAAFRLRRRMSLRARIMAAFGLGALLLSMLLVVLTYGLTRENLIRQRETNATRQLYVNARVMRDALRTADPDVPRLLSSLETATGARPLLFHQGQWFAESFRAGKDALPTELRDAVVSGAPAAMRFDLDSEFFLGVGVPMPAVDAAYFEVVPLDELRGTLDFLRFSLIGAAAITTMAGTAVGGWASRRVLRPLADVGEAAEAIAEGDLDTRLEVGRDVELASLANSFNAMAGALQDRIERDARFASDVSHELRSPLTTLSASIEVLESRRDELSGPGQSALDLLAADVKRFQSMVEDLLEISRFDAGQARLDVEEVRLGELLLHAVSSATERDVEIDLDAELSTALVRADKRRLVRVVANLVENADLHGGGVSRVAVEAADEGRVHIVVDDQGGGVPPEERELIFERFSRGRGANNRGASEGAGLGLALVAEHVALHHGRVWVSESPDGGARFVVELPMAGRQADDGLDGLDNVDGDLA